MSMIGGLIDELNKSADKWNASNMFELAHMCREAADLILELRDDLQRANEAVQDAEHDESRAWDRVRKAEAESEKLRELVRDMYACISHANEADWFYFERDKTGCGMSCTVNGEECGLLLLTDRMRELGIEVDGWLS